MKFRILLSFTLLLIFSSCSTSVPEEVEAVYNTLPAGIDFNKHVKPILSDKCFACHGPDKASLKAGLRLDLEEAAYAELPENPGKKAIVPGNPGKSELLKRILSNDPEYMMPEPSSHLSLTTYEKAVLVKWIKEGAGYKPHWAFIKPDKPAVPEIKSAAKAANAIDHFVIHRLEKENLALSPEADREILLRRVSLDLTGLPATPEETDAFLNDTSPNAYEKQVDRLMASPHYGERIATDWLDVARFADSHGYTVDRLRDMSPWRDWVIRAFNQNLPYNDFITWQLAGDLLPHPTRDQLIATGFNRNHQQNMEGGIVEEEFRVEYVADRTNTTAEAFMAITAGCARCHDHKFDPVSQKEYYEMSGFFNNVKEAGQISWDNAMPVPTMLLTSAEQDQIIASLKTQETQKEKELELITQQETNAADEWIRSGAYKNIAGKRFPDDLAAWYPLQGNLKSGINNKENGIMKREGGSIEKAVFTATERGQSILFDGDIWLTLDKTAMYNRTQPFSVGTWVNIPEELTSGVIFHRCFSTQLYNFRGFSLGVTNNHFELKMAHTAPYNAIIEFSKKEVPKNKWIQLTVTYDGSSKAAGYKLFLNGEELETVTDQDNLYKDIILNESPQSLQLGAWERGKGLTGGKANDVTVFNRALTPLEIRQLYDGTAFKRVCGKEPATLTPDEKTALKDYYYSGISVPLKKQREALRQVRLSFNDSTEKIQEVMIMQEMPEKRSTYLLDRGVYDMPKEEVQPDVFKSILPMPANLPRNRLGLAQWLTHRDHPLTARVAVNRYWQLFFGKGLVKTAEDFGNQGEMPSHPELLDWLAVQFMESGWDVKALIKMMVMSTTYRQQSAASKHLVEKDPENILLARASPSRLTAEMLRDNALFASGLLNETIGGKSVYPYQPEDLWRMNGSKYRQDTGNLIYRRGMYTVWRRSVPNPTQATFDVGIRTSCIVRRQKTNTPLQALVTLNDPTFVEAAKVMGEQMTRSADNRSAIITAFRKLTGRKPTDKELNILLEQYEKEYVKFKNNPARIKGWLQTGMYIADKSLPQEKIAANAVVASTIINTDASITKR
ncbi:MAG: DUF1553 domain-containing protein [Chitinophagaceae bacterium]|nr:DUF1553 domain-containing protein [Chitinophagaceae bacterium]